MVGDELYELLWRWQTVRATMQRPTLKSNILTMIPVRALPERQQKEADHQTHPLLQWHRLTSAGPNRVNRKGKSNWEAARPNQLLIHITQQLLYDLSEM